MYVVWVEYRESCAMRIWCNRYGSRLWFACVEREACAENRETTTVRRVQSAAVYLCADFKRRGEVRVEDDQQKKNRKKIDCPFYGIT